MPRGYAGKTEKPCTFEGCDRAAMGRGLCNTHYAQQYRGKPLTSIKPKPRRPLLVEPGSPEACNFEGCTRVKYRKGLCSAHLAQEKRGMQLRPVNERRPCAFPGCDRIRHGNGLCDSHRKQQLKGQELRPLRTEREHRLVTQAGYIKVYDPTHPNAQKAGWINEHTKVMSEMLGRPLYPEERVHHKNGIKGDNRPENLELWASMHPSGQRVEDLVEFAREILARYGP